MAETAIAWAALPDEEGELLRGETKNFAGGCSKVTPACTNCYAMPATRRLFEQFKGGANPDNPYAGLTHIVNGKTEWTNKITLYPQRLEQLVRKVKPKGIFVSSLTDMMHKDIPDEFLDEMFGAIAVSTSRIYFLTKRPERGIEYFDRNKEKIQEQAHKWMERHKPARGRYNGEWPLRNLWFGTSIGTQKCMDTLGQDLLNVDAVMLWYSMEPLIGPVALRESILASKGRYKNRMKWAVIGGESETSECRTNIRVMEPNWVEDLLVDCRSLKVSPFIKQLGTVLAKRWDCKLDPKKGDNPLDWPAWMRVREFPKPPEGATV